MILKEIQKQIKEQQQGEFVHPCYESYCFSNIPSAVLYLFGLRKTSPLSGILDKADITPAKPKKVVLFLVDGFGYKQWLKYADRLNF